MGSKGFSQRRKEGKDAKNQNSDFVKFQITDLY